MSVTNKPQIEAYIGASGSGKGVSINARLRELAPARLIIWDPRDEYGKQARPVHSVAQLARQVGQAGGAGFKVRYVPGSRIKLADAFGGVCEIAFIAGNCTFVAEELSDVTTASHAPPEWRRITTQGRHRGLHVMGAAQRPTLIDKTFLANCTQVRCFQLGYDADIEHMAREIRAAVDLVSELVTEDTPSGADIRALEYLRRTRELYAVRIKVSSRGASETRTPLFVGATPQGAPAKAAKRRTST